MYKNRLEKGDIIKYKNDVYVVTYALYWGSETMSRYDIANFDGTILKITRYDIACNNNSTSPMRPWDDMSEYVNLFV